MSRLPALSSRLRLAAVLSGLLVAGCATLPADVSRSLPADVLMLGEQHDAPEHQRLHRDTVRALARQGLLAALALEMADRGASTQGLPRDADELAVQRALQWTTQAWPWAAYAPAVMAAVRAGVPVRGANLPREQMAAAMADESLDRLLPATALARQREAIRAGHCDLLPPARIAPMTRIQIARDRAMASTVAESAQPARTVVLLAGGGHVDEALGVPQHLPATLRARSVTWPAMPAQRDYCAQLRQQMGR